MNMKVKWGTKGPRRWGWKSSQNKASSAYLLTEDHLRSLERRPWQLLRILFFASRVFTSRDTLTQQGFGGLRFNCQQNRFLLNSAQCQCGFDPP